MSLYIHMHNNDSFCEKKTFFQCFISTSFWHVVRTEPESFG